MSLSHVQGSYIPLAIRDVVLSYIPLHHLKNANQYRDRLYYHDKWEFFMKKPKPMFGPIVWFDRMVNREEPGIILYALDKFDQRYGGVPESSDLLGMVPTHANTLARVMQDMAMSNHGFCNSGFGKLLVDPDTPLDEQEVQFIENHFEGDWCQRIDERLFDSDTDLELVQRKGYGKLVHAMLWGILKNTQFSFDVKQQAAQFIVVSAAADPALVFTQGVIASSADAFKALVRHLRDFPSTDGLERAEMAAFAHNLDPFVAVD